MTEKHFVDANGNYLGSFDGPNGGYWDGAQWTNPPAGSSEATSAPENSRQKWDGTKWLAAVPTADDVDAYRDSRLEAGYADATTGKTYETDPVSIGKWTALGAAAGFGIAGIISPAPTINIIAADNSTVTLSAADAFALFQGRVLPWVSATLFYARQMKDDIAAGNPPADITAGWP